MSKTSIPTITIYGKSHRISSDITPLVLNNNTSCKREIQVKIYV
jgi:hypothetical protein